MTPNVLDTHTGQLRTIRLYGKLGARFGRVHHLAVNSAAEAVRALGSQLRGFEAFLTQSKDMGFGYAVFYGKQNLSKEDLHNPAGNADIRIAPVLFGAKNGGWVNVIVGAVLIVVGAIFTAYGGGGIGVPMMKMGAAMMVGGVIQLLTPVPKGKSARDKADNTPSYGFNGPINTQAQGNPVPLLYGELIVGSAVLSAGILASDIYVPTVGSSSGSGGSGSGGVYWRAIDMVVN